MTAVNEVVSEVEGGRYRASVTLAESLPGAGDWSVASVTVTATDGSALTADRLRNFGWAGVLEAARRQATDIARDHGPRFARPSDPPAAFRVSRQGRAKRTDRDYAELAAAYLAVPPDQRRKAVARWSEQFGRTPGRWRADMVKASKFIQGEGLTDEGMALVYGAALANLDVDAAQIALMEEQNQLGRLISSDPNVRMAARAALEGERRLRTRGDVNRAVARLAAEHQAAVAGQEALDAEWHSDQAQVQDGGDPA
jgi:hypothetical protein